MSPPLATLAEIEEAIVRDEARLAQHRQHLAECEADGRNVATARELVRLVEQRLAMLNERRRITEAAEGPARSDGWRWRPAVSAKAILDLKGAD